MRRLRRLADVAFLVARLALMALAIAICAIVFGLAAAIIEFGKTVFGFYCLIENIVADDWKARR